MKVKELIEALQELDPNMDVEVREPYDNGEWIDVSVVEIGKIKVGAFIRKAVHIS